MYASYKIHSQRRPGSPLCTLHTLAYALIAGLILLLLLILSATAAQAQGFTAGDVILGPPRVETFSNGTTIWWAEAAGAGLETACSGRQGFDAQLGPHPLDPVTDGIVWQVMDEDGTRTYGDVMAAHLVNATGLGSPIAFDVAYGMAGLSCQASAAVVSP